MSVLITSVSVTIFPYVSFILCIQDFSFPLDLLDKILFAFFCLFVCFFNKIIYLFIHSFIYFIFGCVGSSLLCMGFSLVVVSGGYSSLWCAAFSLP